MPNKATVQQVQQLHDSIPQSYIVSASLSAAAFYEWVNIFFNITHHRISLYNYKPWRKTVHKTSGIKYQRLIHLLIVVGWLKLSTCKTTITSHWQRTWVRPRQWESWKFQTKDRCAVLVISLFYFSDRMSEILLSRAYNFKRKTTYHLIRFHTINVVAAVKNRFNSTKMRLHFYTFVTVSIDVNYGYIKQLAYYRLRIEFKCVSIY